MEPAPSSPRTNGLTRLLAVLGLLLGILWIIWNSCANKNVALLTQTGLPIPGADWIVYPKPPDGGGLYRTAEISTVFRRKFELGYTPTNIPLQIRAMKRWEMRVNGSAVEYVPPPGGNWKNTAVVDIGPKLHKGTNLIEITVFNTNGPPALWAFCSLSWHDIYSSTNWQASLWQAEWKPAHVASDRPEFPQGGPLVGGERPWPSLVKSLPRLLFFALISAAVIFIGRKWLAPGHGGERLRDNKFSLMLLASAVVLWAALYVHNLGLLPYQMGFDAYDHLKYMDYIRTKWKLPFANEGWQMYQPPLYHALGAIMLAIVNVADNKDHIALLLRAFGCAIGAANFSFIFLSLRLLFPGRPGAQLAGLVLAAFVGENLYISQFISNEALCGMLASGALYFCLRILLTKSLSPKLHAALGFMLGAALLAKFTALLAFPMVGAALAIQLIIGKHYEPRIWLKTIGLTFFTAFVVCGWHYIRVWNHFGTPMVGNWDAASGYTWWMEDGYHTPGYFFRFGRCFEYPWFSAFDGFADGLYSTLWGDGLWGGMTSYPDRPPWNYDLMAGGYLLALLPTVFIIAGAALAAKKIFLRWETSWLLLAGMAGATFAALALMCLKVPTYGSAKAFYGLVALLPLCAFAALAFDALSQRWRFMGALTGGLLGVWALTSYASFWIDGSAASTHILLGRLYRYDNNVAAAGREYDLALKLDPASGRAASLVGGLLLDNDKAVAALKKAVELNPGDAESHSQLALAYFQQGQFADALREDQAAISLAPYNSPYRLLYSEHLFALKKYDETIAAATRGLDCAPLWFKLHYGIGLALAAQGKHAEAVVQFDHAAAMDPNWADAVDQLGLSQMALGRMKEAITNFTKAVRFQPANAGMNYHLATAYSADGNNSAAAAQYQRLLQKNPEQPVVLNNLAWIRAANADDRLRDGPEAVRLARRACELTGWKAAQFLGTLAAAFAEAGQFDNAVATAKKAIGQAEADGEQGLAEANRKLLEIYQAGKPFHEVSPGAPGNR